MKQTIITIMLAIVWVTGQKVNGQACIIMPLAGIFALMTQKIKERLTKSHSLMDLV